VASRVPATSSRCLGRLLLLAGVAVWIPYGIALLAGREPDVRWYLPLHLCGVLPGAVITRWVWIRRRLWPRRPASPTTPSPVPGSSSAPGRVRADPA
jgi:hypothetical protein